MRSSWYQRQQKSFEKDHQFFWSNLSRINNLLVILNVSMFFLTGLIAKGYYYTYYSLIGLAVVGIGMLIPTALIRNIWYYLVYLLLEFVSIYFLVASILFWVQDGTGITMQ